MDKKLIQEIRRIKELSKIEESKLDENFIDDITDFIGSGYGQMFDDTNIKKVKDNIKSFFTQDSITKNPSFDFNETTTDDDFYKEILEGIGAPWNNKTKLMLYSWRRAEGGDCKSNPFNTKLPLPGVKTSCCNNECVKNYPTRRDGIRATIQSLIDGKTKYGYDEIIDGLKNSDESKFIKGLRNSYWGTNADLVETILSDYYSGYSKTPPTKIS